MSFKFKLRDGFIVNKFATDLELTFVFAVNSNTNGYLLNNERMFGEVDEENIQNLIKNKENKVAVIDNDKMEMTLYNVDESSAMQAMINNMNVK